MGIIISMASGGRKADHIIPAMTDHSSNHYMYLLVISQLRSFSRQPENRASPREVAMLSIIDPKNNVCSDT